MRLRELSCYKERSTCLSSALCLLNPLTATQSQSIFSAPQKNYSRSRQGHCIRRSIDWKQRDGYVPLGSSQTKASAPGFIGLHRLDANSSSPNDRNGKHSPTPWH